MICPCCGHVNLPGNEECSHCQQDLTPFDRPTASNCVESSLMEDCIGSLRSKSPVVIRPTTPLHSVIQAMQACEIGVVLVTDDNGKLIGIVSERDLLRKVAGLREDYAQLPAGDFMTPNPETVASDDKLNFALHKMDAGGYRHLPVISDGMPLAVISVRDMLRHIARLCKV
jgi:CBS domain-containing protein